jgi:DNA-binding transcriptional regulator YiaG
VGHKPSLPPAIVAYACLHYASRTVSGQTIPISKLLYDIFKQLRERAELSQEGLARLLGVSSKTVSNWERGISVASLT